MYFSRISLRRDAGASSAVVGSVHRLLREGANSAYQHHQLLWRFFPAERGAARDFLYRYVEEARHYYVVSARAPVAPDPAWELRGPKHYEPQIEVGAVLHFELRANPVVSRQRDGRSCRDDVVMDAKKAIMARHGVTRWAQVPAEAAKPLYELVQDEGLKWLTAAGTRHGFAPTAGRVEVSGYQRHRFDGDRGARADAPGIALSTLDFCGELTVTDGDQFRQALLGGVGHGKGFGCGLLLVRRP